jgi:hypothetical protein
VTKDVRVISISQRGYKDSTPLTSDELALKVQPSEAHKRHNADLLLFLEFVTTELGAPKRSADGTGGIILVVWSKGCDLALGIYYFETPSSATFIAETVSSIIFYDPPESSSFGQTPDLIGEAIFKDIIPGEDLNFKFAKYAAGFFANSAKYLSEKGGDPVLEYYRSGIFDPEFEKREIAKDLDNIGQKSTWSLVDEREQRETAAREAIRKMAQSSLKTIGIMWGSEGIPACLNGSWLAEKWIVENGGQDKLRTKQIEGGNHFTHYYRPKEILDIVSELSV